MRISSVVLGAVSGIGLGASGLSIPTALAIMVVIAVVGAVVINKLDLP